MKEESLSWADLGRRSFSACWPQTAGMAAAKARGGLGGTIAHGLLAVQGALTFARLYLPALIACSIAAFSPALPAPPRFVVAGCSSASASS